MGLTLGGKWSTQTSRAVMVYIPSTEHPSDDPYNVDSNKGPHDDAHSGAMDNWEEMWRRGGSPESYIKKVRFFDDESHAFPLTHEQALKGDHAEDVNPAVDDELDSMDTNKV